MTVEVGNWVWECVIDPTDREEGYPGDFFRGRFRICDLRWSALERAWPDGITFRHIKSGALQYYTGGELSRIEGGI